MPLRVLVIDRSPPTTTTQGNELIARNIFPILRRDHHLTLVAPATGDLDAGRAAVADLFDEVHFVPRSTRIASLVGALEPAVARRRLWPGRPFDAAGSRRLAATIRSVVAGGFDVVHIRELAMAGYRADLAGRPALLELIDSETLASARDPDRSPRAAARRLLAPRIERHAMRGFDVVTSVAEADAAVLRHLAPEARVEVVPNGVDVGWYRPDRGVTVDPGSVVFVGAMSFGPNIAAMEWFAEAVLARLVERAPEAHLTIVGRDPVPSIMALGERPHITVTGRVEDVRPYLGRAAVVVAPMVSGSGIKNKILEALAMERPVVATSLAVDGLAATSGRDLLVASDADGFAEAVAGLLAEPARAADLAANGRRLVEARYTWAAAAAQYASLYRELHDAAPR